MARAAVGVLAVPRQHALGTFAIALTAWAVFGLALQGLAPTIDRILVQGTPLSVFVAGQGAIIAFAVLCFWFARRSQGAGAVALDDERS